MKKLLFIIGLITGTTFVVHCQVPNYIPTNGLIGWYPFTGNTNDASINSSNATNIGASLTADRNGNINEAYQFNGAEYIQMPFLFDFPERSVSVWLSLDQYSSLLQAAVDSDGPLMTNGNTGVTVRSDDTLQAQAGSAFSVMQEQPLGVWTNVIISRGISETRFYLNGNLVNSSPNNNTSSVSADVNNFLVGCTRNLDRFFNGKIDDIGLWDRALTECEIADIYNSQLGFLNTTATQTQTSLDAYTWSVNSQTYTQSGMYTTVIPNEAGCDSTITLDLSLDFTGIDELNNNTSKKLVKIVDLQGRETPFKKNTVLLYIFEDGTSERVFEFE